MGYQHVLAAVDLSDEAKQVLREAKQVAEEHGAKLSIISVVKPLTQVYGGLDMAAYTQASVNFEHEAQAQAVEKLRADGAELGVAADDVRRIPRIPPTCRSWRGRGRRRGRGAAWWSSREGEAFAPTRLPRE